MPWIELSVASRHPEFAEEILLANGALSVSFVDAGDDPVLEPGVGETPLWPQTIAQGVFIDSQAGCAPAEELGAVRAALRELLPDGDRAVCTLRKIEDQDWIGAWRQHAQPLRFERDAGPGLWICPSDRQIDEAGAVVVHLDPGMAFGTGSHPSTALCLDWLARQAVAGKRVLDYGCGSGILAIAALKLGAAEACAVDIDPQALLAAQGNAALNRVGERLHCADVAQFCEQAVEQTVDIVLANILARPLIELAPLLHAQLQPGGRIVLAGLLETQAAAVRAAYEPLFMLDADVTRDGWARVSGSRR